MFNKIFFKRMLLREKLTSDVAGLLLDSIRDKGLTTAVSEGAGINRKYFNRRGLSKLTMPRLLRLLVALCFHQTRRSEKVFWAMWWKIGTIIIQMSDDHFYDMCDECRNQR